MADIPAPMQRPAGHRLGLAWWLVLAASGLMLGLGLVWVGLNTIFFRGPRVNLSRSGPMPVMGGEHRPAAGQQPLRVAVATMFSPSHTYSSYTALIDEIGRLAGRQSTLVIRPTYKEMRQLIAAGAVDVGLVCTGPYALLEAAGSAELLVQPELREGLVYRSAVIVPAASSVAGLADLRGRTVACSDPESHTGCFVLRHELHRRGFQPDQYFAGTVFTGSHDRTIEAVAAGFADAGAVHSLILAAMLAERPALRERLRIVWESDSYGPPPVVVPRLLDPALKAQLREAFLHLHESPGSQADLARLGIVRFIEPRPADYAAVIELYRLSPVTPPATPVPAP